MVKYGVLNLSLIAHFLHGKSNNPIKRGSSLTDGFRLDRPNPNVGSSNAKKYFREIKPYRFFGKSGQRKSSGTNGYADAIKTSEFNSNMAWDTKGHFTYIFYCRAINTNFTGTSASYLFSVGEHSIGYNGYKIFSYNNDFIYYRGTNAGIAGSRWWALNPDLFNFSAKKEYIQIAITLDQTLAAAKLYINGIYAGFDSILTGYGGQFAYGFAINGRSNSPSYTGNWAIGDIIIYDHVLTQNEIKSSNNKSSSKSRKEAIKYGMLLNM